MEKENSLSATSVNPCATAFFQKEQGKVYKKVGYLFAVLIPLQWLTGIIIALVNTPYSNQKISITLFAGGFITVLSTFLALKYSDKTITRFTVAVCQMLISILLVNLTEGLIDSRFFVFAALAVLVFYQDWRVLMTATAVIVSDQIIQSGESHWIENVAWLTFENLVLIVLCRINIRKHQEIASQSAELDDNEARYQAVVEQTTEGIFILSQETLDVIECNDAFVNLIGYGSVDEVKKLNAFDFDIATSEEIKMMKQIVREEKPSLRAERKYRKKDGSVIYVEIVGRSINYKGNIAYCVNVRDINDRKTVEKEMKRLALVAQKTQNGVVITNPEGKIQWVNPGFTTITGYEIDEALGKKPGSILQGKETSQETILTIREAIKNQQPFTGEIYNYRKDGQGYWVSISIMPFHNNQGILKGFIGVETDITSQKEMEKALRQARDEMESRVAERTAELMEANQKMSQEFEERKRTQIELSEAQQFLRKIIDNVPNMIFVKDREGRYTLANRALAQLYGIKMKDLIGKTDLELIPNSAEAESFLRDDRQIVEDMEEKFIFEQRFTDKNGNIHWLQTVKRPLLGDSGVENILGISTDMTERKILESQLRHSQKLESIGQLAAGIAHEINTPTQYVGDNTRFVRDAFVDINQTLIKYGELLKIAETGSITSEIIDEIKKEIERADLEYLIEEVPNAVHQSLEGVSRIAKIVQSMKDFAHPGTKDKTAVDLNKAIESTVTVARNEWKYVADLETDFDTNLPLVPCYLGEFNQVVLNMVVNAAHAIKDVVGDASQGKGKITVSTTKINDDWAEIRIADTGTGIPPEVQPKVFDPFFTTKEVGKGSGQGLAISHTVVVEKHNGKLSFETEPGKGTTFIIQLPLNSPTANKEIQG